MAETQKLATSYSPQILVFLVDNSGSMSDPGVDKTTPKCETATEALRQVVMQLQADSVNAGANRYFVSIAAFGDEVVPLAEAKGPLEIEDVESIQLDGNGGYTRMAAALEWAQQAVTGSLVIMRNTVSGYVEERTPAPVVILVTDGDNTDKEHDPVAAAGSLRAIHFEGDTVRVVAAGIAMQDEHFELMRRVASSPEYAVNLRLEDFGSFIASAGTSTPAELAGVVNGYQRPGR